MPRRAKSPCGYPGCPALTDGRYCDKHQKETTAQYNKYGRDPATNARYGRNWRKIRAAFVLQSPLCEECKKAGRLTPVEEVHHRKPLSQGGTNAFSNLQGLCKSCHSRVTATEGGRWG